MQPDAISNSKRKPQGFDSGLRSLAGVFAWTMAVKCFLPAAAHTHNRALLLFAMLGDFVGMLILFLISTIIWLRRKEAACPPRNWAVLLAIIWAFTSSAAWVWISVAGNKHEQSGATSNLSSSFQNEGREIDRKNFSISLPDGWAENTKDDMYDPDFFVFFEGPESTFFLVIVDQKSAGTSVDTLVTKQKDSFIKKVTDATVVEKAGWSSYDGKGFDIEGQVQGIVKAHITVFGFESGDNVCAITEYATLGDYQKYASDFDKLRQTFKLK
jgi:hypothetical protein